MQRRVLKAASEDDISIQEQIGRLKALQRRLLQTVITKRAIVVKLRLLAYGLCVISQTQTDNEKVRFISVAECLFKSNVLCLSGTSIIPWEV